VSLFVLSPEIEDRDEVEVDKWAKQKTPSTLTDIPTYTILSSSRSQEKIRHELIYFLLLQ
jgi:hypothetical protein